MGGRGVFVFRLGIMTTNPSQWTIGHTKQNPQEPMQSSVVTTRVPQALTNQARREIEKMRRRRKRRRMKKMKNKKVKKRVGETATLSKCHETYHLHRRQVVVLRWAGQRGACPPPPPSSRSRRRDRSSLERAPWSAWARCFSGTTNNTETGYGAHLCE